MSRRLELNADVARGNPYLVIARKQVALPAVSMRRWQR
ncbi:hypothetical protein LC55x_4625 [Lysobacter capsici]|nr:hypothetical protein LC55x_4625 [Lysobacter capsici]